MDSLGQWDGFNSYPDKNSCQSSSVTVCFTTDRYAIENASANNLGRYKLHERTTETTTLFPLNYILDTVAKVCRTPPISFKFGQNNGHLHDDFSFFCADPEYN